MQPFPFTEKKLVSELTAKMLFEIEAVHFRSENPFIFTSGVASPVYIDCRKLISFPRIRSTLMDFGASMLAKDVGFEQFDAVAGGETAGIPFAAFIADRLNLPMQYVRKKPKGFGRDARIEGDIKKGQRILEIGCGWGGLGRYIPKEIGCEVHGISLASNQIEYCKKKAREAKLDNLLSFYFKKRY